MRIILNAHDVDNLLDHMLELIPQARRAHAELRSRHLTDRDGYPTTSMGGSGSPTNEKDDDGTPLPQHADPVGRLVVNRTDPNDPAGKALAELVQLLHDARRTLQSAVGKAATMRPPIKHQDPDELWCENCLRAGVHEPRETGRKLCRWCREEKNEHGKPPSPRLIHAHLRGRITPTLRKEIALRDAEDRRAKKRKTKRAS